MDEFDEVLEAAREQYRRREWAHARTGFLAARAMRELAGDDLALLADAAWWLGRVDK
ncbi:MAG: hypothetical protein M3419_10650 [Actinomycetota bacterium]|nr:hypothetical protein [Actinomycetota bacterium]